MTEHIIGDASDFWRLRVTRIEDGDAPEFEWRDDVLYREHPAQQVDEYATYCLEAISVDDPDTKNRLATYATYEDATAALEEASLALSEMTVSEFEREFFE